MANETYTLITSHQKLICVLNILQTIESPNNNVIRARMLIEDEIQDSWQQIRRAENTERDFTVAEQFSGIN